VDEPELPANDLLRQPTRARLFGLLGELGRPASTIELAERLDLHVNGVRRHLDRLKEAGLVQRERLGGRPGRPRDRWSVAALAQPGGRPPQAYGDLARWLARVIPPHPSRLREVEKGGRQIGRELAPSDTGEPADSLQRILTALGFQPVLEVKPDGALVCRLCNCPYRASVEENAEVVCTLHRGITAGLLETLAPEATMTRFEPRPPATAGCLVEVRGKSWAQPGEDAAGSRPRRPGSVSP
jgi:predicted ArsR family transcriptional regulator